MNPQSFFQRALYAVVGCILLIAVIYAIVGAFPDLAIYFTARILHLIDVLIVAIGVCYAVFGTLFPPVA